MLNDGTAHFTIVAQAGPGLFAPHVGFDGRLPQELARSGGASITKFVDINNDALLTWLCGAFRTSTDSTSREWWCSSMTGPAALTLLPGAADERGAVVVDVVRYPELWRTGFSGPPGTLHRWRIDLSKGCAREKPLNDRAVEFPRVAERASASCIIPAQERLEVRA
jgi:hypothetical protein